MPGSAQFEARSSSPVTFSPWSLAVGDFNHDGNLDVAVASSTGQVGVLLGRGDGTFRAAAYYPTTSAVSVATGDFNHDGILDLAVVNDLDQNVSVLLGNGDGTFQAPVPYMTTAILPRSVLVGDFNHDGEPDLLVCDSPYVSVLLGNGDGTFQAPIDTTPSVGPIGIAMAISTATASWMSHQSAGAIWSSCWAMATDRLPPERPTRRARHQSRWRPGILTATEKQTSPWRTSSAVRSLYSLATETARSHLAAIISCRSPTR